MCDFGAADIHEALEEIRSPTGETNWMLLTHVPKSDTQLKLVEKGTDGWDGMTYEVNDGKVMFGFCRFDIGGTRKFVYMAWCGEGVAGMKKGLFNNQAQFVGDRLFTGYHVQINARSEDDLDESRITGEVKKAQGASFHRSHADQSVEGKAEQSSITYESRDQDQSTENTVTGTHITYEQHSGDQSTENAPDASRITYEQHSGDQSTENAPDASRITYEQHSGDQSTENAPDASRVTYESRDADQSTESAPAGRPQPPAPAPRGPGAAAAPAPAPRAPAPAPAPRPPAPAAPAAAAEEEAEEDWGAEEGEEEEEWGAEEGEEGEEVIEDWGEEEEAGAGRTVTALYEYAGEGEGELAFSEGDVITIITEADEDGWLQGELNGVTGYFPGNHVE